MADETAPLASSPTKVTYVDGRPASITLRRLRLEVLRGGRVDVHVFDQDVVSIGATADNDLVVPDETVSRYHCRIFLENDQYLVRDLDSTNGTFIGGVRVREAWLSPGCTLTLGQTQVRFVPVDERVRIEPSPREQFGELVGADQKMREIYAILERIAPTDATVVVEGETGTGKELVARAIHQASRRRAGPFMVFDCGAVPPHLIESELFGHEKGAFTGAVSSRKGVFELAHGGTVFLDELGELSLDLQPKLLRVLEQREVRRVGGGRPIRVDVRVVAATNRDLRAEVEAGRFRQDLYYRLSVVRIKLPPLRERKGDIPRLVEHFLQHGQFNRGRDGRMRIRAVSREAMDLLLAYDWPGNVRELHNVVERAASLAGGQVLEVSDLPEHLLGAGGTRITSPPQPGRPAVPLDAPFKDAKEQWVALFERQYLQALLSEHDGNISRAARAAGIDRKHLRSLLQKHGLHQK